MNKYFKRNGLSAVSPELNKHKIVKKSFVNIAFDDKNVKMNKKSILDRKSLEKNECKAYKMQQTQNSWKPNQS